MKLHFSCCFEPTSKAKQTDRACGPIEQRKAWGYAPSFGILEGAAGTVTLVLQDHEKSGALCDRLSLPTRQAVDRVSRTAGINGGLLTKKGRAFRKHPEVHVCM